MRVPPVVAKSGGIPSLSSGYNTNGLAPLTSRTAVGFPSRNASISVRICSKLVLHVSPRARMQSNPSAPPQVPAFTASAAPPISLGPVEIRITSASATAVRVSSFV